MKEVQGSFDPLDRATLRVWQSMNVLVWSLAGIAAGVVVHVVIANLDTIAEHWLFNDFPSQNFLHQGLDVAGVILSGAAIGTMIGRHVFRTASAYAGMAAVFVSVFALRLHPGFHDLPLVAAWGLQIATAIVSAARAERRRPLALRGGRRTGQ